MRSLIIGLGVQGRKRAAIAGTDVVGTVDPVAAEAQYRSLDQVPFDSFDAALVCTPDRAKVGLLERLLGQGKHVLVEKPMPADGPGQLQKLADLARRSGAVCYTAYNHRFEPHVVRLKGLLDAGTLGTVYQAQFFYGNGTARDVRGSPWRDQGTGVLADLGSHLLDLVLFLFGPVAGPFRPWAAHRFENRAFDHVVFAAAGRPALQFEVSLLSWRNSFSIDIVAERGSAHLHGLCKWGPSTLTVRERVLPSGRPREDAQTLTCPDPTWALEYAHFQDLCRTGGGTNLANDVWIGSALNEIASQTGEALAA
jgi:scyllo-inositol 2-dehydrogenase (NADP+)